MAVPCPILNFLFKRPGSYTLESGPILAEAVLYGKEEIKLRPIYRDNVHDFGFFQFDPSTVKHMALAEIPLSPELAKVGIDVRVVSLVSLTLSLSPSLPHFPTLSSIQTFQLFLLSSQTISQ